MLRTALGKLSLVAFSLIISFSSKAQNQALDLSGAGNEVNVTYNLSVGGFTVEQWVYMPSLSTTGFLVNQTNTNLAAPLDIYVQSDGSLSYWFGDGTATNNINSAAGVITPGTWHHVAVVYDPGDAGNERKVYVDGNVTPVISGSVSTPFQNIGPIRIGRRSDALDGDDMFVDEVRIWSIARTGAQITADFNTTIDPGTTGLDVYLKFENDLTDFAGGDQSGSIAAGSIGYVPGAPLQNNALNFDGTDDLVNLGSVAQFNIGTTFTFETWINLDSYPASFNAMVFNKWQSGLEDKIVSITPSGNVSFSLFGTSVNVTSPSSIPLSQWVHIAATYDGANAVIYINGALDVSAAASGDAGDGTGSMYLGGNGDGRSTSEFEYLDGSLDEVRFWNVPRTQNEIHNSAYSAVSPSGALTAYYDFNIYVASGDNSGATTLFDAGGNGLHGTLTGPFALNFSSSNWVSSTAWDNDVFAPLFDPGFPSISDITTNSFDINSNANESGLVYGVVLLDGEPAPSSAEVKAGTGQGGSPVQTFFNFGTNATANDVGGDLFHGTAYDVYLVAEDFEPNVQPVPTKLDVTTLGTLNNTLFFDGVDDYVEIPDNPSLDITSDLTIETWVRFSSIVDEETVLVSKWNPDASPTPQRAYLLQVSGSSDLGFIVSNDGTTDGEGTTFSAVQANYSFGAGRWYHVVGTYSPSNALRIYVNGELIGENTTNIMPSIFNSNSSVVLGANGNFGEVGAGFVDTGVAMELDETRIWSLEKTQADIQNDMFSTLVGSVTNLNASYSFDYTDGTTLFDDGSLGNNGTLNDNNNGTADGIIAGPIWEYSTVYDSDVIAPFNVSGYPFIDNITESGFEITTQLSEVGTLSYVVLTDGASTPGKDDIRGGTGFLGAPPVTAGTINVSTPLSEFSTLVSGLSASTNYDVYMVAEDLEGVPNVQNNVDFFDVTTNAAPVQNALDFDGTDDYISGTGINLNSSDFTVEAWFNTNDVTAAQSIFSLGSGGTNNQSLHVNLEETQVLVGFFFDDVTIPYTVTTGWNHIAVTHDATTRESTVYINGQPIGSGTHSGNFTGNTDFTISRNAWDGFTGFFDGQLDELRVWNSVRNQTEIAQNRYMELDPGLHADLVAYYQFNESTGTNVPDVKNAFNGTWNGSGGGAFTAPQWVASTALDIPPYIVTNTGDNGTGSLRDAITYANANPGTTISFLIDEPAPWEITLSSVLPQITAANTIIDGTTQPNWNFGDANGMVTINGSSLGTVNGIDIDAAGAEIYGLIFTEFNGNALNGHVYLASDAADDAVIGASGMGNIFHNTDGNGIYIVGGDNATIQGNRFGTLDGVSVSGIGMGDHGIATTGEVTGLTIGGDFFAGEGNLISGAGAFRYGLNLNGSGGGSGLTAVSIRGNKIGTNDAANGAIPNTAGGINLIGNVSDVTIGGSSPSDLNIISGNGDHGIRVQAGDDININGNYIGIQSDGSSALGNGGNGIQIETSPTNINIGDTYQNIISENVEHGIFFNTNNSANTALGTNIFSCNASGGIGYNSGPLTPGATIDALDLTTAIVSTGAADGSNVYVYYADDGCSNDQGVSLAGSGVVASGQAIISGGFAPSSHYVALVEDVNGYSTFSPPYYSNFIMVTNTDDTGTGSLRDAIDYANSNPGASIYFNISFGDPNYADNAGEDTWTITPATSLPTISVATVLDATSQPGTGNFRIVLDGSTAGGNGFRISGSNTEVYGFYITGFATGMYIGNPGNNFVIGASGKGNTIVNCSTGISNLAATGTIFHGNYIGTDEEGSTGIGNSGTGISFSTGANNITIGGLVAGERNVISGNATAISINASSTYNIIGNYIGTDPTGLLPIPNTITGIGVGTGSGHNILDNVISGNTGTAITLNTNNTIIIQGNFIGVGSDGTTPLGNDRGIGTVGGTITDITIGGTGPGEANIIANNTNEAISVDGSNEEGFQIIANSIYCNGDGIFLNGAGNNNIVAPSITAITASSVDGTGTIGETIHVYRDNSACSPAQGQEYLGTGVVDGSGNWSVTGLGLVSGDVVTATTTNGTDGTSGFSSSSTYTLPYPSAEGAGEALLFSGSEYVVASESADEFSEATISAWVYHTDQSNDQWIYWRGNTGVNEGAEFYINTSGQLVYGENDGGYDFAQSASSVPLNSWTHVAAVRTPSSIELFINGEAVGNNLSFSGGTPPTGHFAFGARHRISTDGFFVGQIDEVRIWNVAREEFEIRQDMTHKIDGLDGSLVAYYRMDDSGDAANLSDFNNGNDGIINGATYTPSGAHIGDESTYDYSGSDVIFYNFETRNLDASGPLHIYRISQTPATANVLGLNNVTDSEYYGVFAPGRNYSVVYYYPGLSADNRLVSRDDATFGWSDQGGFFGTIAENEQLISAGINGSRQFASAIDPTPYPTEQGAGYALSFNGSSDQVSIPDDDNLSFGDGASDQPFSIEAWVKLNALNTYQSIVSKRQSGVNREYRLAITSLNEIEVLFFDEGSGGTLEAQTGGIDFNTNDWYHLAFTYDGSSDASGINIYLNGVLQSATPSNVTYTAMSNTPAALELGIDATLIPLNGQLDEVRIWNTELIESDIRQYMIEKIGAGHPAFGNLVAAYKFDENNASTAIDVSGGNDGTITGATPVVSGAPQGDGSLYTYTPGPFKFDTAPDDDIVIEIDDASNGFHIYYVAGTPNQDQADGFSTITESKFYGFFAPGQTVDIRMDYNNGGSQDPNKRILYRENGADNAASGGWERLSGLLNNDPTTDSLYAFNVPTGEIVIADLAVPSSYPTYLSNDPGDALDFVNGTNGYVEMGAPILSTVDGAQTYTIEFWMNSSQAGSNGVIFSQYFNSGGGEPNRFNVTLNGSTGFVEVYKDTDELVTSATTLNDGAWHHVAIVKTVSGVYEFYVDGSLDVTGSFSDTNPFSDAPVILGSQIRIGSPEAYYIGLLDEVRVWKTAVSGTEIMNYANTSNFSSHPNYADMLAYYRFDDGTGSTILEDLFGGNDGALFNIDENTDWVASGAFTGDPEIEVRGLGVEIVSGDNTPDVADDTDFGDGGVSHPVIKTYTINNTGTSDLILGTDAAGASGDTAFEVGQQPDEIVTAGGSTTFTVVFTAPAEGVFNSEVQISSNDSDESFYTFDVTGNGIPAAPSQQASNIIISNVTDNSADISWTFGNGWGTAVAIYEGYVPFPAPVDNTTYNADATFGTGDEMGTGWFVVYNGTGTSVSVTGLNPGQEYTVAAIEYYGDPGAELYNTSPDLDNPNGFITTGGSGNPTINEDFEFGNIPSADYSGTVSLGSGDWFANSMSPETSNTQSGANAIAFNSLGDYIETFEIPEGVVDIAFSVNQNSGAGGDLDILISTDGGSSFSPIEATGEITNTIYQEHIISIGTYEPTIIRIEATLASEPVFLDDITIQVQGGSPSGYFEDFATGIPGDWITFNAMWDNNPSDDFSGIGGSANIQSGDGNYLETPYLNGVNDISFQYKSGAVSTPGFVFDVLASSDGGLTFDIVVADNVTDIGNSYTEFTHNFGSIYDGPIRIQFDGAGDTDGFIDEFSTDGVLGGGSGSSIFEDFESGNVPGPDYTGSVTLGSGEWFASSVSPEFTNTSSGTNAIALDQGDYLETFISEGVADVSIYVNQQTGAGGEVEISYSTDGGSIFDPAGNTGFITNTTYEEHIFSVGTSEPIIIRIEALTANEPIYIDDITINLNEGGLGPGTTDFALDFDGSDDHLVAASITELGITNGTIEAWIYPNNLNLDGVSPQRVLAKPSSTGNESSPYQLIITDGGAIRLTIGNGGAFVSFDSNTGLIQPGMWQHIGVTWDGSNVRFFYDGVEDVSFVQSMTPNTNTSSLIIGGFNGISGTGQFNGAIDDVRIWNFARTESEINNDKDFLLMGNESGLVAYYPMSDGTGSLIASDKSNLFNDATLTNMDENTDWIDGPGLVDPGGGEPGVPRQIYFTTPSATDVYKVEINGGVEESLVASNSGVGDYGIAYSASEDRVYYIDGSSGGDKIMSVMSDGQDVQEVTDLGTSGAGGYGSLALDTLSRVIYAITPSGLQSFNMDDGTPITNYGNILIGSVGSVSDIEIFNGVLYWSQSGSDNGIATADLTDISGTSQLIVDPVATGFIRGLAIDPTGGRLYWTTGDGEIRHSNFDGSDESILIDGLSNLEDLEMNYENRHLMYVTDNLGATIESIDTEGTPQGTLLTFSGSINFIHPYSVYNPIGAPSFNFFEDFDTGLTASTDPSFILSTGIWEAQGVQSVASIDPNLARNGEGDAAYMFFGTGNYLVTPYLENVNEISFWYKADPVSAGTFDFDVYGSSDGGETFDNLLGSGSTDGTEFIEFTHSFGSSYDGPIQIIYTGGGSESGVIDDFGSDGSELRSTLNLSSLVLGNQNVAPGQTDVLIYKIRMDVSDADVTSEGFFVTPVGSFNPSDIQNNSIRFYQSINADVPDPVNDGTFLGSTNIASGDPIIPDGSIGLLFTQSYIAGDAVYYYVVLNIDVGATPGNSFNIQAPSPNDNFGFISAEQFDNGLQDGDVFTISSGDVTAPEVVAVNTNLSVVADGNSELEVLIEFDEDMIADGSQDPVITFPVEDPSSTLTFSSGVWDDGFNYTGFFTVSDANETIADIDVRVSGAQDLAGNTMADHDEADVFSIDTENPYVVSITRASADPTNGPSVDFEVTFNESVNDIDNDDFVVTTVSGDATATLSIFTGASGTTATVSVFALTGNGTIRLDYLNANLDGVVDDNGNPSETDYLLGEVYTVDNIAPVVTIDSKSTSITSPELTGTVDDPSAVIEVTILGNTFVATNNGSTWTLPQGTISPALTNGTYNVEVEATDAAGNVGSDATVDELVVQLGVTGLMVDAFNSTSITMIWDAGIDVDFYSLDVSTESDFSTFLSGYPKSIPSGVESESLAGLDYSEDYYFRIRLTNTAGETSASSATVKVRTTRDATTAADSVALRQIYDAIGGSSWTPAVNWTFDYMRDWGGITLDATRTRVEEVDIAGVGAAGDMPNPFTGVALSNGGLSLMSSMNVSDNEITGLMDFTSTSITNLDVSGNNLTFDDLEPLTLLGIPGGSLDYANQASIQFDPETNPALLSITGDSILIPNTQNYTVAITTGGSANQYTWYLGGDAITTSSEFTVAGSALEIVTIDYDNMGTFRAEVTSPLVPGLTINVDPQIIYATAEVEMRLTDFDDNLLTGETFQAALLEALRRAKGYDTLARSNNVSAEFTFSRIVLGDYLCGIEPDNDEDWIPSYFGDTFQWDEAETIFLRGDVLLDIVMTEYPEELTEDDGEGTLDVLIEDDFGADAGRIDARRRAAKRKCGLRKRRRGGRTDQEDDVYDLIAYGETDDNGEFQFGFLPEGTYRFFVEYPGIPLTDASAVQFEVGEAGISDTDFKLSAFATEDGIEITIEAVLGVILEYFKDLQIYPNPSSKYLNVSYRHLKSSDVTAQLVDLSGNTKWSQELSNGFDGQIKIDVSDFAAGLYILRFYDRENPKDNVVSYRVMVRE